MVFLVVILTSQNFMYFAIVSVSSSVSLQQSSSFLASHNTGSLIIGCSHFTLALTSPVAHNIALYKHLVCCQNTNQEFWCFLLDTDGIWEGGGLDHCC